MTTLTTPTRTARRHWLVLVLAVVGVSLMSATPLALPLMLGVLGYAIYRLTCRPTRTEAVVLIAAIVILVSALAYGVTASIAAYDLTENFEGTSTSLEMP
jgi:hypothetical protein